MHRFVFAIVGNVCIVVFVETGGKVRGLAACDDSLWPSLALVAYGANLFWYWSGASSRISGFFNAWGFLYRRCIVELVNTLLAIEFALLLSACLGAFMSWVIDSTLPLAHSALMMVGFLGCHRLFRTMIYEIDAVAAITQPEK